MIIETCIMYYIHTQSDGGAKAPVMREAGHNPGRKEKRMIAYTDSAVSIDIAQVVRCKDCKYLMFSDCYGECRAGYLGIVKPDDFCGRGKKERKIKNAPHT